MGGAGLQELVDEYHVDTVKLDREIPDDDFPVIAAYFDGVDLYSQAMNLSAADQATVRNTLVQYNVQEAMAKCLSIWKSHYSYKVTFRALLELLLQRLNKVEVAVRVCRYLAQNVSTHFMSVFRVTRVRVPAFLTRQSIAPSTYISFK